MPKGLASETWAFNTARRSNLTAAELALSEVEGPERSRRDMVTLPGAIIPRMKLAAIAPLLLVATIAFAQTDADHHAGVVSRGESHTGMGFSQTTTTHHFILTANGGIVQVTANDPKDTAQISTIQMHLKHIAEMFSEGNFSIPHFVHGQTPPAVETMKRLQSSIHYTAESLDTGARVRIETISPEAVAAIHDFLRFQIKDHETGDPLTERNP